MRFTFSCVSSGVGVGLMDGVGCHSRFRRRRHCGSRCHGRRHCAISVSRSASLWPRCYRRCHCGSRCYRRRRTGTTSGSGLGLTSGSGLGLTSGVGLGLTSGSGLGLTSGVGLGLTSGSGSDLLPVSDWDLLPAPTQGLLPAGLTYLRFRLGLTSGSGLGLVSGVGSGSGVISGSASGVVPMVLRKELLPPAGLFRDFFHCLCGFFSSHDTAGTCKNHSRCKVQCKDIVPGIYFSCKSCSFLPTTPSAPTKRM